MGASVQCRVLSIDLGRQQCLLTLKKKLLTSPLPLVTSYEQAQGGAGTLVSHGFVTAVKPKRGVIVTFYNNVHGIVSEAELERAVRWRCWSLCAPLPVVGRPPPPPPCPFPCAVSPVPSVF